MQNDPLAQLEADAAVSGVEMEAVLKQAGVAGTTWWRWKEKRFEPRAATVRRMREALVSLTAARPSKSQRAEAPPG